MPTRPDVLPALDILQECVIVREFAKQTLEHKNAPDDTTEVVTSGALV